MRRKTVLPPVADGKWRIDDDDDDGDARSSPSSEWLNHSTGGPKTKDIFARPKRGQRRDRTKRAMRLAGLGAVFGGRGLVRLGRFSYRQMQPMRLRDWISVGVLVVVLAAMGAYMMFEKHTDAALSQGCRWYTVDVGDTLITLARASGVSVGDIARANGIYDVKDPPIGQQICLPSGAAISQAAGNVPHASQTTGPVIQGEAAYVRFVLPYARQVHNATGWPVSMLLAQWGLEQGWQTPTFTGYNFGNCGGLANEPFIPGTAAVGSPSTFAYADTPEDGIRFYIHVAGLSFYDKIAPAARSGGPEAAAKALGAAPWDAGHYTNYSDPGSSLIALMRQYHLTQYD